MKRCPKCGAVYADQKQYCVDCNERLREPLSAFEEEKVNAAIEKSMEKISNKIDPLHVSVFDIIMGVFSIICIGVLIISIIISGIIRKMTFVPFVAIFFFALATAEALIPQTMWEIEKFFLSFRIENADDMVPTVLYKYARKVAAVMLAGLGMVFLVLTVLLMTDRLTFS